MGYLYPADYNKVIQEVSLQQIISGDRTLIASAELFAQGLMVSHLRQKYDTAQEFTNTQPYNPQVTYNANDRVYLDALAYSALSTYTEGQLCLQSGKVYQCIVAIMTPELFNSSHWQLLGSQFDLFYANYPYPVFNLQKNYSKGDQVFWKNRTYTCIVGTWFYDHQSLLQFEATYNIPPQNYFPDDSINGSKQWRDDGLFVVPAGNLLTTSPTQTVTLFQAREDLILVAGVTIDMIPGTNEYTPPANGQPGSLVGWTFSVERRGIGTMQEGVDYEYDQTENVLRLLKAGDKFGNNEIFIVHFQPITNQPIPVPTSGLSAYQVIMTYFTKGDNRNQQMVAYMIDVMVYRMYSRIAPKNIPEDRESNYKIALMWLRDCAKGDDITADLVKIQPAQGKRIRGGSDIKRQNSY